MNKIEEIKNVQDGLDSLWDIYHHARVGFERISEEDAQRMKWYGVFQRNPTPGYFMVRVRITNGMTNARQFRVLADLADETGKGFVHLTTRQQVQLRWARIEDVPRIFDRLRSAGLHAIQTGMDNVRNVCGCPVAGLTQQEVLDAYPVARAFAEAYVGNPNYSNLPRKFNMTITGCPDNCTHAETQDVALVPAILSGGGDSRVGFNVLIGGKNGSGGYRPASPLDVFVTPDQAVEACFAILGIYRDFGYREQRNHARLAFLVDDWGIDKFRAEVEKRLGRPLIRQGVDQRSPKRHADHVGVFRQKQSALNYVGLTVPVGKMTSAQMRETARLSERYGTGDIRLTVNQNLVLANVPDAGLGSLLEEALVKEFPYAPSEIMRGLVACTGTDFCNLAVIEVKDVAVKTARAIEARIPKTQPLTMHWSGCPAGCGNHQQADIGFLGKKIKVNGVVQDGVDVYVGGRSGPDGTLPLRVIEDIPLSEVEDLLVGMVQYHPRGKLTDALRKRAGSSLDLTPLRAVGTPPPAGIPGQDLTPLRAGDITDEKPALTEVDGKAVAVFRHNGRYCAVSNLCPHENAPLNDGVVEGDEIICPLHAYRFNLLNGACSTVPGLKIETYDVIEKETGEIDVRGRRGNGADDPRVGEPSLLWTCRSCHFAQRGARPPAVCPVCAAGADRFSTTSTRSGATTVPHPRSGRRVVIVGGGIAGHLAAQTCRQMDASARIVLVTDEASTFYNRLGLTRLMSEEIGEAALFDYSSEWYADQGVEVLTRSRAGKIDARARRLQLESGEEVDFDVLLLAHGSSALPPPFYRNGIENVFLLRTLDDVRGILSRTTPGSRAAVIGGGVLGLEAAHGLLKRGAGVSVFEFAPHLMPRQLDTEAARLLAEHIESNGVQVHCGAAVTALDANGDTRTITLADGRVFEADFVVISTGIRPNTEWVSASGIKCGRGVLVDDRMRTSCESVYAAGDVAEWRGQVVGLWANAIEQARVAAANAMGQGKTFAGSVPATILKCWEYPVFSIGETVPTSSPNRPGADGIDSKTAGDPGKRVYRRILYRHGMPIGGIVVGTKEGVPEIKKLVEWQLHIRSIEQTLFTPIQTA